MESGAGESGQEEKERWLEEDFWANPAFAERAIKAAQQLDNAKEWISLEDLRKRRAAAIDARKVKGAKSPTIR